MNTHIDLHGASGAVYRFRLDNPSRPENASGGLFVYARESRSGLEVVRAGATDSLARAVSEQWPQAAARQGATHLFTRLHVSSAARAQELDDLRGVLDAGGDEDGGKPAVVAEADA